MSSLQNDQDNFPPDEHPTVLYIGQHELQRTSPVVGALVQQALDHGYDMLTIPITTAHFQSRVLATLKEYVALLSKSTTPDAIPSPLISPLLPADTELDPTMGQSSILATTSPWIDLGSPDPLISLVSRQVLNLEVAYAAFCGVSYILIQGPASRDRSTQFARAILEALSLGSYLSISILLPMIGEVEETAEEHLAQLVREPHNHWSDDEDDEPSPFETWDTWHTIRTVCNYNSRLSIALEVPRQLPGLHLQNRWYCEPVRLLNLPRTTFLRNQTGYPVLSKEHQQYFSRFFRQKAIPLILLSGVDSIETSSEGSKTGLEIDPTPGEAASQKEDGSEDKHTHLQYMRHLQKTQAPRPPIERYGQGYQDFLQSPLQPLTDNLESNTYEVFERDPIKYTWYERAIALALKDLQALLGSERPITVAVVGAGRGPLVTRVLLASRQTGVQVVCWAVEKNPNAQVLLQRRNTTDPLWNREVTVVKSDMRNWSGPVINGKTKPVDLFVSELLGSFADNELSPECLDGAQHLLHPTHGISIPQSYTAHLTPIAAPRLYSDICGRATTDLNLTTTGKWDLPYVVMLHQYDNLSTTTATPGDSPTPDIRLAWKFSHPQPGRILAQARSRTGGSLDAGGWLGGDGSNEHNIRQCTLTFSCRDRGVCHGLAGYFETILYASKAFNNDNREGQIVELSTNPLTMESKSKDMISWYPIFFPLKTPLYIPDEAEVDVSMWRQTDDRKVWYEWIVEVFYRDLRGKRLSIGSSELHSSRKNACLM